MKINKNKDQEYYLAFGDGVISQLTKYELDRLEDGSPSFQGDLDTVDQVNALKRQFVSDFPREIWLAFDDEDQDHLFSSEFVIRRKNDRVRIEICTSSALDAHDKFKRNILIDSLVDTVIEWDNIQKKVHINSDTGKIANVTLEFYPEPDLIISKAIQILNTCAMELSAKSLLALENNPWKPIYLTNEKLFTIEILIPLLKRMNFSSVKYNHGTREFGKDILFSERDKFGSVKHYGVQVKAGDINGKVNSQIDEIIGQIDDCFSVPIKEFGTDNNVFLSEIYIIISGKFTSNAIEKIVWKTPPNFKNRVRYIDYDMVLELIAKYWR